MRRRGDGEQGQSLVEFALVLPILALLLLGVIDIGRIASARLTVSDAARDGVRYASVGDSDSDVGTVVQQDSQSLSGPVQWSVTPAYGVRQSGDTVTVDVSYSVPIFDPLLAAILGTQFSVQSTMSMRVE